MEDRNLFSRLNLAKGIADHMLGENHSLHHRYMVSGGIMISGVLIAHYGAHLTEYTLIQLFSDLLGYLIHGIGALPFAELVLKMKDNLN